MDQEEWGPRILEHGSGAAGSDVVPVGKGRLQTREVVIREYHRSTERCSMHRIRMVLLKSDHAASFQRGKARFGHHGF